jgi:hypothetical protein
VHFVSVSHLSIKVQKINREREREREREGNLESPVVELLP